jgi:hypothetical protein
MTDFYDSMANLVRDLLAEFGPEEGFACRQTTGSFDKVRGGLVAGQTQEQVLTGVRVPVNQTIPSQLDQQQGEMLTASQVVLLKVAAVGLDFDLALGQIVVVDGREMPIVSITPVKPGDTTLLYTVALRK